MEADTGMGKEKANWTTSLHEQTHLKPHEWWRQDGEVTEWAKVRALISLIYLTSVEFHPGPCHKQAKHSSDQLRQKRKSVHLCEHIICQGQ